MFADFLPSSVVDIRDSQAIALRVNPQRRVVQVPFEQGTTAIATAYIHYCPDSLVSNTSPVLLFPGFDSSLLEFRHLLPLVVSAINREIWILDLFGFGFTKYLASIAVNPHNIRQHLLRTVYCG